MENEAELEIDAIINRDSKVQTEADQVVEGYVDKQVIHGEICGCPSCKATSLDTLRWRYNIQDKQQLEMVRAGLAKILFDQA